MLINASLLLKYYLIFGIKGFLTKRAQNNGGSCLKVAGASLLSEILVSGNLFPAQWGPSPNVCVWRGQQRVSLPLPGQTSVVTRGPVSWVFLPKLTSLILGPNANSLTPIGLLSETYVQNKLSHVIQEAIPSPCSQAREELGKLSSVWGLYQYPCTRRDIRETLPLCMYIILIIIML